MPDGQDTPQPGGEPLVPGKSRLFYYCGHFRSNARGGNAVCARYGTLLKLKARARGGEDTASHADGDLALRHTNMSLTRREHRILVIS